MNTVHVLMVIDSFEQSNSADYYLIFHSYPEESVLVGSE